MLSLEEEYQANRMEDILERGEDPAQKEDNKLWNFIGAVMGVLVGSRS